LNHIKDSNIVFGFDKLNTLFSEIDSKTQLNGMNVLALKHRHAIEPTFKKFINGRGYASIVNNENAGYIEDINNLTGSSLKKSFQLINSISFDAQLKYQKRIEELPFYINPDESSFIKMVVSESTFNYYSDPAIQAVELPIGRGNYNIVIVVPKGTQNLRELALKMNDRLLNRIKAKFKPRSMEVYLPVIGISGVESFKDAFKKGRLYNCFNQKKASFSKLSKANSCYMSDFEQRVDFNLSKMDEEQNFISNEALEENEEQKTSFLIDHPFIFIVYEKYSEAVILLGKVNKL
jgi:serpin B